MSKNSADSGEAADGGGVGLDCQVEKLDHPFPPENFRPSTVTPAPSRTEPIRVHPSGSDASAGKVPANE